MKRRSFVKAILSCPVCAALGAIEWDYGDRGPAKWSALDPEYSLCRNGKQQSPIDLRDGAREQHPPVKIDWKTTKFTVVNNGHTIQANAEAGNSIDVGGARSELVQFHFHAPSEHAISGKRAAMEAHFVHRSQQAGRLTVLAVLLNPGAGSGVVSAAMGAAQAQPNGPAATIRIDPRGLLPASIDKAWRYEGSLTTPPCSEGVEWIILAESVAVAKADIDRFHAILPANARPLQPLNGRKLDRP